MAAAVLGRGSRSQVAGLECDDGVKRIKDFDLVSDPIGVGRDDCSLRTGW